MGFLGLSLTKSKEAAERRARNAESDKRAAESKAADAKREREYAEREKIRSGVSFEFSKILQLYRADFAIKFATIRPFRCENYPAIAIKNKKPFFYFPETTIVNLSKACKTKT